MMRPLVESESRTGGIMGERAQRPWVIVHNAVSADGRIDHLTVDVELYYEMMSRWEIDVHLTGSETILAAGDEVSGGEVPDDETPDNETPENTPSGDDAAGPLLVVPDSRGRIRHWHLLKAMLYWRGELSLCSQTTPPEHLAYLNQHGIEYLIVGEERVDLRAALEILYARYGARTVLVDSGGTLNGALFRAGLVDEVSLLVHPALVGGTSPKSIYRAPDLDSDEGVIPLRLTHVERMRGDVVSLRWEIER
jgi:2,5-diamino-6-(ribosylamino)-4(3H)-pyrimidinone 5'-phosphate reductase